VASTAPGSDEPYSVIELEVDGSGTGSGHPSFIGEVVLDEEAGTVTLNEGTGVPSLLANVKREAPTP
jgi:hypothetical protein